MGAKSKLDAYVAAFLRHDGDETLIAEELGIHQTQLARLSKEPAALAAITSAREGWVAEPTEAELLAEMLHMARKANAFGQYSAAGKIYTTYGERNFGWTNRTEVTGKDGGAIEIDAVQLRDQLEQRFARLAVGAITTSSETGAVG